MHVAIVALGPSYIPYIRAAESGGSRQASFDEVWTINQMGNVINNDLVFHMDDVRIQELRAEAGNKKVENMLKWLKNYKGNVLTSRSHPDYSCLIDYPLEDVINTCGSDYFNNTSAYAIAYGIYKKVSKMSLFGMDFTWPNVNEAEAGKACCEYWCGRAHERGIEIAVSEMSGLLDGFNRKLYGYDTLDVKREMVDGKCKVTFTGIDVFPTAEEIENRYDHSK